MASESTMQPTVLVVDFGAQYAQLIARRVRDAQVYSEIVPHRITAKEVRQRKPIGIILSGGPASVHVEGAPLLDPEIYELGVPILGICYGCQLDCPAIRWRSGSWWARRIRANHIATNCGFDIAVAPRFNSCTAQCVDESL
jgi:carbamoylphosphate synthase small subunit